MSVYSDIITTAKKQAPVNFLDYLENLPDNEKKEAVARARELGILDPTDEGLFTELGQGAAQAGTQMLHGFGSAAEEFGLGSGLKDWADETLATNQQWREPENMSVAGYIGRAIGEGFGTTAVIAPAMAADMLLGTKGVATFATLFASSIGENIQRNREAYGEENSAKVYGLAAAESLVDAGIEQFLGTVPMLGKALKKMSPMAKGALVKGVVQSAEKQLGKSAAHKFFVGMAKNGLEEAGEESLQYINGWFWQAIGDDPNVKFSLEELRHGALKGGIGGVALGTIGAYVDARSNTEQIAETPANTETASVGEQDLSGELASDISGELTSETAPVNNGIEQSATERTEDNGQVQTDTDVIQPDTAITQTEENIDQSEEDTATTAETETIAPEENTEETKVNTEQNTQLVKTLADVFKLKVQFFDEAGIEPMINEDGSRTDGMYDTKTGITYLDRNSPTSVNFLFGHEFKHFIDAKHKDLAATFDNLVKQGMNKAGEAELNAQANNFEEFSADTFGRMITDSKVLQATVQRLEQQQKGLGEKLLKAVQDFINAIKKRLKAVGTPEAKALFDNMTELQKTTVDILSEIHKRQNGEVKAEVAEKEDFVKDRPEVGETFEEFFSRMEPKLRMAIAKQQRLHPTHGNYLEDDLYAAGVDALSKTYMTFAPEKGNKISTLANTLVKNAFNDVFAKEMRKNTDKGTKNLSLDKMNEDGDALYESVADTNNQGNFDDVSFANDRKEFERRVEEFKKTLNPQDRKIIELHLQEVPPSEIARAAGVYEKNKDKIASRIDKLRNKAIEDWGLKLHVTKAENADNNIRKVKNIKDITDDDFFTPTKSIQLPPLPDNVLNTIGKKSKPVLLKKNILEKNRDHHKELSADDSRQILEAALYHSERIIQDKPTAKPNYWVMAKLNNKNSIVTIELSETKDNYEIVGWRYASMKSIQQLKNRAEREGGQVLITKSDTQGSSGLHDLSFGSKEIISQKKDLSSDFTQKNQKFNDDVVQNLIAQQRTNLADVSILDLNSINSIIDNFKNASDKIEKNQKKFHTTKPRQQINPIVKDGEVRDGYQDLLENKEYTPETIEQWDKKAVDWIQHHGGVAPAMDAFLNDMRHADRHVNTLIVRHLLESDVAKNIDPDKLIKLEESYIEEGTAWGREGAARRLASLTLDRIERVQALFNKMHEKIGDEDFKKLRNKIFEKLGIDIASLDPKIIEDKNLLDATLREFQSGMANKLDKAYEFWINSILSAPATHIVNTAGNTANIAYEFTAKRLIEAGINLFAKRKDAATFGEFKEMWKNIDWKSALENAKTAFNREMLSPAGKFREHSDLAIGGKLGRIIRIPGRALRFMDELARSIVVPMETAAQAYRSGIAKGLKGAELQKHIQSKLNDTASAEYQKGITKGKELTFQEDPGKVVQYLINMKNEGGFMGTVLKYILPFISTPANILKQGIRKSPLGAFNFGIETAKLAMGKRKLDSEYLGRAAEQFIAWGTLMMLAGMDDEDDNLPFITGSSTPYGTAEQRYKEQNIPPYSIRIGGTYVSYKRIEPLATMLSITADALDAWRMKDKVGAGKAFKTAFSRMGRAITEKSYLNAIDELMQWAQAPDKTFASLGTNFAASWMPNAAKSLIMSADDEVRNYKSYEKESEFWKDQFHVVTSKAGFTRRLPKVDCFGNEITKENAKDAPPAVLYIGRLVGQYVKGIDEDDKVKKLILNYNYKSNPDAPYWPDIPKNTFTYKGEKCYFGNEDYHDFAVQSGKLAKKQLDNAVRRGLLNINNPTEKDIKLIKNVFSRARKQIKEKFVKQKRYSKG